MDKKVRQFNKVRKTVYVPKIWECKWCLSVNEGNSKKCRECGNLRSTAPDKTPND